MGAAVVSRFIHWTIHVFGAWTISTFSLLVLMLIVLAQSINGLVPALDTSLLLITVVLGEMVGWVIARTRMPAKFAVPLIIFIGVCVIVFRIGQLGPRLIDLVIVLSNVSTAVVMNLQHLWSVLQTLLSIVYELGADVVVLFSRIYDWAISITSGRSVFDPVAASMIWSIGLWSISTWAAWSIRRNWNVLRGTLPALALLTMICAYTGANTLLLALPALSVLLLLVIVSHGRRESSWTTRGIDYSEDIRTDIALVITPITIGIVAIGWLMPTISVEQIAQIINQAISPPIQQAQPLPDSLGLKPQPVAVQTAIPELRAPGLPRSHLIGSGSELSHETVMVISTGDLPPVPVYTGIPNQQAPHYYWRSTTYDYYTGEGWVGSDITSQFYRAAGSPISSTFQALKLVRQQVAFTQSSDDVVYRTGSLVAADRDFRVAWRSHDDAFAAAFTNRVDAYTADSLLSNATVEELQTVTNDYPEWISERYLALPADIPQRVLTLARDLTAIQPTPYDRATAIESFLRTYSYTLDIPTPPLGKDVADYFLFDLQRGYCDYFATSMVVLARAAGLPARLVVGYASGTYDATTASYVVTQADAHSWPEIYFNEYGWVEFEPTSGRAPLERPATTRQIEQNSANLRPLVPRYLLLDEWSWLVPLTLLVIVVLATAGWVVWDIWSLRQRAPRDVLYTLYARLYTNGRRLDVVQHPGDTPYEYSFALLGKVAEVVTENPKPTILSSTRVEIHHLVDLYVRSTYGGYQPDNIDRWQLIVTWQRLRWQMWITIAIKLSRWVVMKRQALLAKLFTRS